MSRLLKTVIIIILLLAIFSTVVVGLINYVVMSTSSNHILTREEAADIDADCVIVLGAGVYADGSPTPMLYDRLAEGVALYKEGAAGKIIMSGDHGRNDYNEVGTMKAFAVNDDVPSEDVFMDHAGFSTYESIYRARDVFQAKKVIIVTQKYHMYRALYIAKKLGLDAVGVCSDPRQYAGQFMRDAREILARVKDFIICVVKPKPTFLGDAIPVFGNGDVTND